MTYPDNFFEIDFLDVETASSGDAITLRVGLNGVQTISVVDGGYADCGQKIVDHIKEHYDGAKVINHVVLTHPDGDHAAGLKGVLENFTVERLWINRPWMYAEELIRYYPTYNDISRLKSRLRSKYPHIRDLEAIAEERGVLIQEAFQGVNIGHFHVMAPSKDRFLELVLRDDDKAEEVAETASETLAKSWLVELAKRAISFIASAWGEENLPEKKTSPRNEMTIVQFAQIGGEKILLTGDAGQEALTEAINYAPVIGLSLPGIDRFQVPHHGSRRNVSTQILDQLLGPIKESQADYREFTAVISSAEKDTHHPKKAVVRAMIHRGGIVATTEGRNIRTGWNAPPRDGWGPASPLDYPTEQEE